MGIFTRKAESSKSDAPAAAVSASVQSTGKRRVSAVSHRALIRPVVSEKAAALSALRQYVFMVEPKMNKVEIAKVINALYGVTAVSVRIVNVRGKRVRTGRTQGVRKSWKKAMITLKEGESIALYQGV